MEMHHKLRRDPNWHPNGCNICGQLGHQAAVCPNGTINWRSLYGDKAFMLRPPLYSEQWVAIMKPRTVDFDDIAKRASDYSKTRLEAIKANPGLASQVVPPTVPFATQAGGGIPHGAMPGGMPGVGPGAAQGVPPGAAAPAAGAAPAEGALPDSWATAKDSAGRTYYWHTVTKKVQWEKPTPDTPIQ